MAHPPQQQQQQQQLNLFTTPGSWLEYATLVRDVGDGTPLLPGAEPPRNSLPIAAAAANPRQQFQLRNAVSGTINTQLTVFLAKATGATQVYAVPPGMVGAALGPNVAYHNWGRIFLSVTKCPVSDDNPNVFLVPEPPPLPPLLPTMRYVPLSVRRAALAGLVAIKRFNRAMVETSLRKGHVEDPYKEVARMSQYGDNMNIVEPIEILQDEEYLYIVTPMGYTLHEEIQDYYQYVRQHRVMPPERALSIMRQVLKILLFFEQNKICHRYLKPDNLLFLCVNDNRDDDVLVAIDLAMSVRIPDNESRGRRALIQHHGDNGTKQWTDPIVYQSVLDGFFDADRYPGYDGVFADLWAAGIIFYALLTNHMTLYSQPVFTDLRYRYYIGAGGLFPHPTAETMLVRQDIQNAILDPTLPNNQENAPQHVQADLIHRQPFHDAIPRRALDLFQLLLQYCPRERVTLGGAIASDFIQNRP